MKLGIIIIMFLGWEVINWLSTRTPIMAMTNWDMGLEFFTAFIILTDIFYVYSVSVDGHKASAQAIRQGRKQGIMSTILDLLDENKVIIAYVMVTGFDTALTAVWIAMLLKPLADIHIPANFQWMVMLLPYGIAVITWYQQHTLMNLAGHEVNKAMMFRRNRNVHPQAQQPPQRSFRPGQHRPQPLPLSQNPQGQPSPYNPIINP